MSLGVLEVIKKKRKPDEEGEKENVSFFDLQYNMSIRVGIIGSTTQKALEPIHWTVTCQFGMCFSIRGFRAVIT